jgi:hypothetical protein
MERTDMRENREFASELKFLVNPALAGRIRDWARTRLPADRHGTGVCGDAYRITSLYFDTEQFDVFQRNGSFGRSKYRIRRYGHGDVIFLERKLRTNGLLAKRRALLRLDQLPRLSNPEPERGWNGCWFHRRILARRLQPVCRITYHRTARAAMTPHGPIRLTLDENMRALATRHLAFNCRDERVPVLQNGVILELKFRFALPTVFKLLVEEFALNPRPVSKYRLAIDALGLVPQTATLVNTGHPSLCPTS